VATLFARNDEVRVKLPTKIETTETENGENVLKNA
jgi:hypothetical protein